MSQKSEKLSQRQHKSSAKKSTVLISDEALLALAEFVDSMGSIDRAKSAIDALQELQKSKAA